MEYKTVQYFETVIKQHEEMILQLIQMTAVNNHAISKLNTTIIESDIPKK